MDDSKELTIEELAGLAQRVDHILKEELEKFKIDYDVAETRVFNARNVGILGDQRSYAYPAEVTIRESGKDFYNTEFLSRLSTRITNEVLGINRVVYHISPSKPI